MKNIFPLSFLSVFLLMFAFADQAQAYYSPTTGRFINRDPIGERGGVNTYAFVRNDGVNHFDYLGMKKAEGYDSHKDAAAAAIKEHFKESQTESMEYGGLVCLNESTQKFSYTQTKGNKFDFEAANLLDMGLSVDPVADAPCPEGTVKCAFWHTHPFLDLGHRRTNWRRDLDFDTNEEFWEPYQELLPGPDGIEDGEPGGSEKFSPGDLEYAKTHNIDAYVGTAGGKFLYFSNKGGGKPQPLNGFGWDYRPNGKDYIKPKGFKTPEEWKRIHPDLEKPAN